VSGALGSLTSLISRGNQAFSGAQNIAAGVGGLLGFGSTGPISLGSFVFSGFEVPASVAWGGQQAHTVHKLPGGGRVVDVTGRDDRPVEWSGIFLGQGAEQRAIQLDGLRNAGRPLMLTWGQHNLQVLIASFEAETRQIDAHVSYRISCTVLSINQASLSAVSPMGAIASDIAQGAAVVQTGIAQVGAVAVGVTQVAQAAGIRVPLLNQMQFALIAASGATATVGSLAATVPGTVSAGLTGVRTIADRGVVASAKAMLGFNAAAPANPVAAVAAVTAGGDAVSAQAEASAVSAFAGAGMAQAA